MTKPALSTVMALVCLSAEVIADLKSSSRLAREEGAVYLEDMVKKPIKLKVLKPANGYSHLDGSRYLGTFLPDREVILLAISDKAYRVRGRAQQGDIAAWAGISHFSELKPEFLENLKKMTARKKEVDEMIARHEVAMGMTLEEVVLSLGKPNKKESRVDKEGRKDTYHYITYKKVPQTNLVRGFNGQIYRQTTYIQVETGRVSVEFENEVVVGISHSENETKGRNKVIPAPLELVW